MRTLHFFYNRVKGEMEEALIAQKWPRLTIARPSMLLGDRTHQRMNETLFAPLFRLLPGNWKSIDARDVAARHAGGSADTRPGRCDDSDFIATAGKSSVVAPGICRMATLRRFIRLTPAYRL
ncbi:putative nucleoside-diphosphate-sugar epimerase [Salmonella bongori]|nr:putative nucleoside-diphosphate-sugar epimerase [Salmonella bongori]